jgi:hypothetical protein
MLNTITKFLFKTFGKKISGEEYSFEKMCHTCYGDGFIRIVDGERIRCLDCNGKGFNYKFITKINNYKLFGKVLEIKETYKKKYGNNIGDKDINRDITLWLDDKINPRRYYKKAKFFTNTVVWVNSYTQFVDHIKTNGIPEYVSFDYDLSNNNIDNKNGYDCAVWLIKYCIKNNIEIPEWDVHCEEEHYKNHIKNLFKNYGIVLIEEKLKNYFYTQISDGVIRLDRKDVSFEYHFHKNKLQSFEYNISDFNIGEVVKSFKSDYPDEIIISGLQTFLIRMDLNKDEDIIDSCNRFSKLLINLSKLKENGEKSNTMA